jgi:hypothetical protein
MKNLGFAAACVLAASSAQAESKPTNVPDVVETTYYQCESAAGAKRISALAPQDDETCSVQGVYIETNPERPGLEGYAAVFSDGSTAILINDERFKIDGDVREAWVMLTYATPHPYGSTNYSRIVAKWTVDCAANTVASGTSSFYNVSGDEVSNVATKDASAAQEPMPNTAAEAVMKAVCSFAPSAK